MFRLICCYLLSTPECHPQHFGACFGYACCTLRTEWRHRRTSRRLRLCVGRRSCLESSPGQITFLEGLHRAPLSSQIWRFICVFIEWKPIVNNNTKVFVRLYVFNVGVSCRWWVSYQDTCRCSLYFWRNCNGGMRARRWHSVLEFDSVLSRC